MRRHIAALVVLVVGAHACPAPCKCYTGDVDCSERNLTALWTDMFNWTGAEHLPELDLQGNKLMLLPPGIFDPLWGLKTLNLNSNQLQALDVAVFSKLKALKFLDMKENHLSVLPVGLFASQNKLIALDLRRNLIQTLDDNVLAPLLSLSTLALKGNPLVCNCSLQPAVLWSRQHSEGSDAECRFPAAYSGKHWSVLERVACTTRTPHESTSTPRESSTTRESTSTPRESTSTPRESTSTPRESTSTPHETTTTAAPDVSRKTWGMSTLLLIFVGLACLLVLLAAALLLFLCCRRTHSRRPNGEKATELLYDDVNTYDVIQDNCYCSHEPASDVVRYVTVQNKERKCSGQ